MINSHHCFWPTIMGDSKCLWINTATTYENLCGNPQPCKWGRVDFCVTFNAFDFFIPLQINYN
jgi:hypothetical protein